MAAKRKSQTDTDIGTDDVAALKAQLAEMTNRATTAEGHLTVAQQAKRDAVLASMSHEERALMSEAEACDSNIANLTSELDAAEAEVARLADEPGNGAAIAKLNRAMATATSRLLAEEGRKEALVSKQAQFKTRSEARPAEETGDTRVLANGTPLNAYGPATQAWLLNNPQSFTDRRFMGKAVAAAIKATEGEGIKDQSPEYFAFIESELGMNAHPETDEGEEEEEGEEIAAEPAQRAQAEERYTPERPQTRAAGPGSMAAAPPTRQVPQGGGNRQPGRTPALTAAQREVADSLYASVKNPADRYKRYAENMNFMNGREPGHFMPRN